MNVIDQRIACRKNIAQKMNVVLSTVTVEQTPNFVTICLNAIQTAIVLVMNAVQNSAIVDLARNIVVILQQHQQNLPLQKSQLFVSRITIAKKENAAHYLDIAASVQNFAGSHLL